MSGNSKVIIAGGTGALGAAVVRVFKARGYEVHIVAENTQLRDQFAARPEAAGVGLHVADLTVGAEARLAFAEAGGPLGAFVTTAGGFAGGPLAELTDASIDRLIALNLKTTLIGLREAYPYLKQSRGGASAVVVGARSALTGGAGIALYSATKAAVVNLAYSLAQEWLNDGITVNAVLPSTMDTPANRAAMPSADFARWPTPDQVAQVVAFLASEHARIISGGAIPVYGRA